MFKFTDIKLMEWSQKAIHIRTNILIIKIKETKI